VYLPSTIKVMHAARQDMEIFYHLRGQLPYSIFDTQIAAPLLGHADQIGYATLVEHLLGTVLNKAHTRTNWAQRPLTRDQLQYAADDVRYLARIYPLLRRELELRGRLTWLEEDFAKLCDSAQYANPPHQAWIRIKGAQTLRTRALAALQSLAAWREETAQQENLPRAWLLRDEQLCDLARAQPDCVSDLARIRGLPATTLSRHGETLLHLIAVARTRTPDPWPVERRQHRLSSEQEAVVDLLTAAAHHVCHHQNIHPSAVTTRKELERLVIGDRDLQLLRDWRLQLLGETLLNVLSGGTKLAVKNNAVHLEPAN
jgi:ribonuclease D